MLIKAAIGLVLLAHGIGHSMGLLQVFKVATINPEWHGDSWLLTGLTGTAFAQAVGVVAWTAAMVGFIAIAGVVFGTLPSTWWSPVAIVSALASLTGLLPFPIAARRAPIRRPRHRRGRVTIRAERRPQDILGRPIVPT